MLSRVAENLYWAARYLERAENLARLTSINHMMVLDLPRGVSPGWEPLLDIVACREAFEQHFRNANEANVVKFLTVDTRNPSSILNAVSNARNALRSVQEVIPRHVWQLVNSLHLYVQEEQKLALSKRERYRFLEHITHSVLTIFGALDATMNHNVGFMFMRFGMYLERADMTSRIIDVRSANLLEEDNAPYQNLQWISVLRSLSAYQMYRLTMGVKVQRIDVLEFMLQDENFPRSVMFCLSRLHHFGESLKMSGDLQTRLQYAQTQLNAKQHEQLKGDALHAYIDELQVDLAEVHSLLTEQFFNLPINVEHTVSHLMVDA
jgi:uncharacterized alpha-E superfamily protein